MESKHKEACGKVAKTAFWIVKPTRILKIEQTMKHPANSDPGPDIDARNFLMIVFLKEPICMPASLSRYESFFWLWGLEF